MGGSGVRNCVCVTIDVEDFYDGMAVLGHDVARPAARQGGLAALLERLEANPAKPKVTLFVVSNYAPAVRGELADFAAAGHEIACHGPDHGRMPSGGVATWLRKGRETLEDLLGVSVRGFRSPRFDVPEDRSLARYRDDLATAGYGYVSDSSRLGSPSPVREVPVLSWRGIRVGGGAINGCSPCRPWWPPQRARRDRRCSTTTPTTSTGPCPAWARSARL